MKTIKQIAEEMGISKQALLKKINNLPSDRQPEKVGGRYIIDHELEMQLKDNNTKLNGSFDNFQKLTKNQIHDKTDNQPTTNQQATDNQSTTNQQPTDNHIIDILKDQIQYLQKQLDSKDDQIFKIQKLLENQQILTLKSNERLKQLETEKERKSLFDKIFKKSRKTGRTEE